MRAGNRRGRDRGQRRRSALGGLPGAVAPTPGVPRPADRARPRPGTIWSFPSRSGASCVRWRSTSGSGRQVYEQWGFASRATARPRHLRAVRRPQRHRQDDGGRSAGQRAAAGPLPHRPQPGGEQVHRRDREEPAAALRRGRGAAAPSCSSTRRTPCSASAARSRTATTATPTSRSATCCSGWRPTAAWPS